MQQQTSKIATFLKAFKNPKSILSFLFAIQFVGRQFVAIHFPQSTITVNRSKISIFCLEVA